MKPNVRNLALAITTLVLLAIVSSKALADPPENEIGFPDQIPGAKNGILEIEPADPKTQQQIRDSLDGKNVDPGGDGMLEDVLNMIESQGSVLKGSMLDESTTTPPPSETRPESTEQKNADHRAQIAESLLRTARLLRSVGSGVGSNEDEDLIALMRQRAATLLMPIENSSDATISPATQD